MKVSALIEYLKKYLETQGDVDLNVEIGGNPKVPPPDAPPTPISPPFQDPDLMKKLMDDWLEYQKLKSWHWKDLKKKNTDNWIDYDPFSPKKKKDYFPWDIIKPYNDDFYTD
jgi:hypothetical protein